jgi:two-component system KDP operon response regulator KdpE
VCSSDGVPLKELLARVRVALRHASRTEWSNSSLIELPNLKIDLSAREASVQDKEVHLTPIEFKLLASLVRHPGKVLTHQQLLKDVWGPGHIGETHYLRVFMTNMTRKLKADPAWPHYLLTVLSMGYRSAGE